AGHETRQHAEADAAGDHRGGADHQEGGLGGTGLGELVTAALGGGGGRVTGVGQGRGALLLGGGAVAAGRGGTGVVVAALVAARGGRLLGGLLDGVLAAVARVARLFVTAAGVARLLVTAAGVARLLVTAARVARLLVTAARVARLFVTATRVAGVVAAVVLAVRVGADDAAARVRQDRVGLGDTRHHQRRTRGDDCAGSDACDADPRLLRHMRATPSS